VQSYDPELAAVLAFILHAAVDFPLHIPANAAIFFALLSWLAVASSWVGFWQKVLAWNSWIGLP
jgi:hypothetical protein